jgi:aminotransferase
MASQNMTSPTYQICTRCILDTSDPEISFDLEGVCNHCRAFDAVISKGWHPNKHGEEMLHAKIMEIKAAGVGKKFDCIIGLSGGIDSSYLAIKLKEYDLRVLAVHVDAGWNSELAVHNIERIVDYCGFEYYSEVLNWREVADLQLAFLKSGVANQDVPQDHGFFATLYKFAMQQKIKYVINGGNIATESVFPANWHHSPMDAICLNDIHRRFGTMRLKSYRTISFFEYYIYFPFILGMKVFRPLNYMPYDKRDALKELLEKVGYKEYDTKHGESVFTRFFQNHFLIKRFGYDKRRPHLSCLILSGQLTREAALEAMKQAPYNEKDLAQDRAFVARKLGISEVELDGYISQPLKHYTDYKNWDGRYRLLKNIQKILGRVLGRRIGQYS